MNNYQIIWSPKAYKDLQNIYTYITQNLKEKNIANNLIKKLLNSISSLNYLPERYVRILYPISNNKNLRKFTIDNYIVVYEVVRDTRSSIYSTYFS